MKQNKYGNMFDDILETYSVLINRVKNWPGSRFEDVFPEETCLKDLENEMSFIKMKADENA